MVRKDIHICPCWKKAIEIWDGYEADMETSPVHEKVVINLTGDNLD